MSLKHFHIIFIAASIILIIGFGFWAKEQNLPLVMVLSFLLSLALLVYEITFIRKIKS